MFLVLLPIIACQRGNFQSTNKLLEPLPQDPLVQVYFNHTQSSEYREPYRQQIRLGDDLEKQIIDTISQAESTIDVAVQELRLPNIAQALVNKHKAGVKVRLILENTYNRPWSSFTTSEVSKLKDRESKKYHEFKNFADINKDGRLTVEEINQRDALVILQNAKVPIIDDTADGSKGSGLMHHKFVIVDNRMVIVTSANFTMSGIHGDFSNPQSLGNVNNLLLIDSPKLASIFTEEFNIMWGDGESGKPDSKFGIKKPHRNPQEVRLGDSKITVNFSPTSSTKPWINSSNGLIGKNLQSASKSIDMALFVFSAQDIANILENRHRQSVNIRTVLERDFAYRFYSEGMDMMGVAISNKCKYEVDNLPWKNPISTVGVALLPEGDLLHHKFSVIDGQKVITGSHNWTEAANNGNDETLLIIESPQVAAHYSREFERTYKNVKLGVPPEIQTKIKLEQQTCSEILKPSSVKKILTEKVNLNTATLEELESLPGVGKKLAQRIIKARQQQPFTSLEDLDKVPGIGEKMLLKLSDKVTW
ncbi:MAG: DUF655 domain-containing protein [Nostocaceae cyanobacterium]|nr:DUF655 domain-containing protein [Nostocaceae cyanobacterium]